MEVVGPVAQILDESQRKSAISHSDIPFWSILQDDGIPMEI